MPLSVPAMGSNGPAVAHWREGHKGTVNKLLGLRICWRGGDKAQCAICLHHCGSGTRLAKPSYFILLTAHLSSSLLVMAALRSIF